MPATLSLSFNKVCFQQAGTRVHADDSSSFTFSLFALSNARRTKYFTLRVNRA